MSYSTLDKKGLLSLGQVVSGRYKVKSIIAYGKSTEVYLVEDSLLNNQLVTLTLFDQLVGRDPRLLAALQQELLVNRSLRHPNILQLYDASFSESTHDYITSEYVNGITLSNLLKSNQTDELSLEEAVYVFVELAAGLSYAHQQSIIHRDIKASKALISSRGDIRIRCCGRPKVIGRKTSISRIPDISLLSPEQARDSLVDEKSNQYSLGLLLYGLLAGMSLIKNRQDPELLPDILSVRAIPKWVAELVNTCTQVDRANRFESLEQALLFAEEQTDIDRLEEVARSRLQRRIYESRRVTRKKRTSSIGRHRNSARFSVRPKKTGD